MGRVVGDLIVILFNVWHGAMKKLVQFSYCAAEAKVGKNPVLAAAKNAQGDWKFNSSL